MKELIIKNRKLLLAIGCFIMTVCIICMGAINANAVSETSRTNYTLMSGVTESTIYATDSLKHNVRIHALRVQNGANVSFKSVYKDYYKSGSTAASRKAAVSNWSDSDWGYEQLRKMAKDYNASSDAVGTVIAASNGDFYTGYGVPAGNMIMEGNALMKSNAEPFFAVLKDGSYVIRPAGGSISDVEEAIAGSKLLVADGKVAVKQDKVLEPRQALGVTSDGAVVIINVDGREPSSPGVSLYDLAMILKQQGCVNAINFDGGGSATFLTKRSGDSELKYRNVAGDGFERNVSSSLLVVKNSKSNGKTVTGSSTVSMKSSSTVLKKSSSGKYSYKINGAKQTGFRIVNGKTYLFKAGAGLTKTIKIGDVKYTFKKGALTKCSDKKAGTVLIGYCGGATNGENLIYAYHKGDKLLKVGLNPLASKKSGKMMDWNTKGRDNTRELPWYSMRSEIKKVYIGDGVTNIGERFMYVASTKIFDGSTAPKGKLTTVRFPSSLKTIGNFAFYNKPKLKNVTVPSKVTKIGSYAFSTGGKGYIKFTSSKAAKFGKLALGSTKYSKVYVKKTSSWKKFVSGKKFKKYGFKKTVSYK